MPRGEIVEILIEFLFSVVGEVLLQIFFEVVIQVGRSTTERFRDRQKANPVIAGLGLIVLGSFLGFRTKLKIPCGKSVYLEF